MSLLHIISERERQTDRESSADFFFQFSKRERERERERETERDRERLTKEYFVIYVSHLYYMLNLAIICRITHKKCEYLKIYFFFIFCLYYICTRPNKSNLGPTHSQRCQQLSLLVSSADDICKTSGLIWTQTV